MATSLDARIIQAVSTLLKQELVSYSTHQALKITYKGLTAQETTNVMETRANNAQHMNKG